MSSTRTAKPGAPLRQERFASAYASGLLANLVAKRCAQIEDAGTRATIWFLQWLSWQPGGLCAHFGAAREKTLFELCLNPKFDSPKLLRTVADYRAQWIQNLPSVAQTTVGRRIADALNFTRQAHCLTLIDGPARIGKSFSAEDYCQRSAGLIRFIAVPCSSDDISFFRAIAKALGVSSSLKLKSAELRLRIEETLANGDLALIFDEGHYCFPQNWQRYAMPSRVNWIMTALANSKIAAAIITTPQFFTAQKKTEELTGWNGSQFDGRIAHIERLPEVLPIQDLLAVARSIFPEGDSHAWQQLAGYADLNAQTKLAGMRALAQRARWLAGQQGRAEATPADLRSALREGFAGAAVYVPRPDRQAPAKASRSAGTHRFFTRPQATAAELVSQ